MRRNSRSKASVPHVAVDEAGPRAAVAVPRLDLPEPAQAELPANGVAPAARVPGVGVPAEPRVVRASRRAVAVRVREDRGEGPPAAVRQLVGRKAIAVPGVPPEGRPRDPGFYAVRNQVQLAHYCAYPERRSLV